MKDASKKIKYVILQGSPKKHGNTASITDAFAARLNTLGHEVKSFFLHDMDLKPCLGCRGCQKDWSGFNCVQHDDMQKIFDAVLACDVFILATPIYSWYCTPPMKCVLDRLVYGMDKYYGEKKGPSLWKGKRFASIATCGYPPEKGTSAWEDGMIHYAKHSDLVYLGLYTERHLGYDTVFMDDEKKKRAEAFADELCERAVAGK